MGQQTTLEITDRDGWSKEFALHKAITHIGSDPRNDIVLEGRRGAGVAARHLQVIYAPANAAGQAYRVINLGDSSLLLSGAGVDLAPRASAPLSDGERLGLGDFTLIFHLAATTERASGQPLPAFSGAEGTASAPAPAARRGDLIADLAMPAGLATPQSTGGRIGIGLSLPDVRLGYDHPIDGTLTVRNQGEKPGVQFKIEVENLPGEVFELGPAPILFPGAEKGIPFRLHHPRGPIPPAGEYRFTVRVTAADAYPGESATVTQTIQVLPFYRHTLRVLPETRRPAGAAVRE